MVDASNSHGDLTLKNLTEECKGDVSHGNLFASRIIGGVLKGRHSSLNINQVAGDLAASTSHGKLILESASGRVELQNSHGDIVADNLKMGGDVKTHHGKVQIDGVSGNLLKVAGRHSRLKLQNISTPLIAATSHGAIEVQGDSSDVECNNSHGDIRLKLMNPEIQSVLAKTDHGSLKVFSARCLKPKRGCQSDPWKNQ